MIVTKRKVFVAILFTLGCIACGIGLVSEFSRSIAQSSNSKGKVISYFEPEGQKFHVHIIHVHIYIRPVCSFPQFLKHRPASLLWTDHFPRGDSRMMPVDITVL